MTEHSITDPATHMNVVPYGDAAVMVTARGGEAGDRRAAIRRFRTVFAETKPAVVTDLVSGLESLLVEFDPRLSTVESVVDVARLMVRVAEEANVAEPAPAKVFEIPIVIDDETAPDLGDVAEELGSTPEQLVDVLRESEFSVSLLAAAMAPMMDGLNVTTPVRRRATPRTDVPPGSIMLAGTNALIQPYPGPSGWRVVGRTPLTIVDIARERPVSFGIGDVVRFKVVSSDEAETLEGGFLSEDHAEAGTDGDSNGDER